MNTVTHVMVGAALLIRRRRRGVAVRGRNVAALVGSLLPDLYLFVFWGWSKLTGTGEADFWRREYFQEPIQTVSAISNSAPLYAGLLAAGLFFRVTWLWVLAAAALAHLALDFPVHASDAHVHFWPFSDWRFRSPVSYWEGGNHAGWINALEIAIVLACVAVLWRRFGTLWIRALVLIGALAWITPMIYFRLVLGG